MLNKRLLIKNLLAHNDENSFYDKKRQLNLHTKEGKAKFLKHICSLSNSNPANNSYIVVGVEDENNEITGVDFYDDSKIQNLVNAFLNHAPKIQYENVHFPHLPTNKVVGLVTIKPKNKTSSFKKNIHTISIGTVFIRIGSNSVPTEEKIKFSKTNIEPITSIENNSRNSIAHTLEGVLDFLNNRHKDLNCNYKVFKELFIVCWAGIKKKHKDFHFYSRVDIELINEQIKLFYSNQDEVTIEYNDNSFIITEYISLGLNDKTSYYPLEKVTISFFNNGYYKIDTELLFTPPQYNPKLLDHIYQTTLKQLELLESTVDHFDEKNLYKIEKIPSTLMICYLNGFENAKNQLIDSRGLFKKLDNPKTYNSFKESMRILRKMKYN